MRNPIRYFNSSPAVIRLAVMMYIRYPLSLRQVEDLLFERGIDICQETVRLWWNRFGPMFAAVHASILNHFNQDRHLNSREIFKQNRSAALAEWRQLVARGLQPLAFGDRLALSLTPPRKGLRIGKTYPTSSTGSRRFALTMPFRVLGSYIAIMPLVRKKRYFMAPMFCGRGKTI